MTKHENQIVGQSPAAEAQAHLSETEFAEKYPDIYEIIRENYLGIGQQVGWSNWNMFEALDFAYQKGRDCDCEESELYEREVGKLRREIEQLEKEKEEFEKENYNNKRLSVMTEAENAERYINTRLAIDEFDEIDEPKKEIESLKSENKQLKEDNNTLSKNQMVWVDSSGKAIDGLLGQASDEQLAALLAKNGYHGEISRSEYIHDDHEIVRGEKIETIKIG